MTEPKAPSPLSQEERAALVAKAKMAVDDGFTLPTNPRAILAYEATVVAAEDDMLRWRRAFNSVTPGGSEYAGSPELCVRYVRERHENIHGALIDAVKARQALTEERDAYRKALEEVFAQGDGFGPHAPPNNYAGTTGDGHAACREIARVALLTPKDPGHEGAAS